MSGSQLDYANGQLPAPPNYPSLISGFSCGPTPDGVWMWNWDVITFVQHTLSNQDNLHQTANYKGRVELGIFPLSLALIGLYYCIVGLKECAGIH